MGTREEVVKAAIQAVVNAVGHLRARRRVNGLVDDELILFKERAHYGSGLFGRIEGVLVITESKVVFEQNGIGIWKGKSVTVRTADISAVSHRRSRFLKLPVHMRIDTVDGPHEFIVGRAKQVCQVIEAAIAEASRRVAGRLKGEP